MGVFGAVFEAVVADVRRRRLAAALDAMGVPVVDTTVSAAVAATAAGAAAGLGGVKWVPRR